jgi:hypothetical protein
VPRLCDFHFDEEIGGELDSSKRCVISDADQILEAQWLLETVVGTSLAASSRIMLAQTLAENAFRGGFRRVSSFNFS